MSTEEKIKNEPQKEMLDWQTHGQSNAKWQHWAGKG